MVTGYSALKMAKQNEQKYTKKEIVLDMYDSIIRNLFEYKKRYF